MTFTVSEAHALRFENVALRFRTHQVEVQLAQAQIALAERDLQAMRAVLDAEWRDAYGVGLDDVEPTPDLREFKKR